MFCVISAVCSKTICIFLLPQQVPNEIQSQTYSKPDMLSSENALVMWEPYGCHSYVVPSATHFIYVYESRYELLSLLATPPSIS